MSDEPKPCPFCGSVPMVSHVRNESAFAETHPFWSIGCNNLSCLRPSVLGDSAQEVAQAWNRRAASRVSSESPAHE